MNYVILDFQHFVPPFIVDIAEEAARRGHKLWFLSAGITRRNGEYDRMSKIANMVEISGFRVVCELLRRPAFLFQKAFRQEFSHAKKQGVLTRAFLKNYFKQGLVSNALYACARRILASHKDEPRVVLASWFHVEAFAAAMLKEKDPGIVTASLAHSFEVNPDRNRYVCYMQNAYRHRYIDKILFISETVRAMYRRKLREDLGLEDEHTCVAYLGSHNDGALNPPGEGKAILTCSNCVPLKRLDLLMACYEKGLLPEDVSWTHFGDGPEYERLTRAAASVMQQRPGVSIRFAGRVSNAELLDNYAHEHVDLFLNVSTVEGLPVSIMEALSFGVPVAATDVGGTAEILDDGCGFLLPADLTPEQLAECVLAFFALPADRAEAMRAHARERWAERFDAGRNIPRLLDAIESVQ